LSYNIAFCYSGGDDEAMRAAHASWAGVTPDEGSRREMESRMRTRTFGRTGREVSEIGFGAWAIGSAWGKVDDAAARAALHAALDAGITFIDTADVYGDGHSEQLIAQVMKERSGERPFIATKAGRRLPQQSVDGYSQSLDLDRAQPEEPRGRHARSGTTPLPADRPLLPSRSVRASRQAGGTGQDPQLRRERRACRGGPEGDRVSGRRFGADHLQRVPAAPGGPVLRTRQGVPLASGLLSGKFRKDTTFEATDHRQFNRHGEAFDVGETFSGVPYEVGLAAVEKIRPLVPGGTTMAKYALRWILMFDAVTVAIPGARNPAQAVANAEAADLPPIDPATMDRIRAIYDSDIRPYVHQRW
jgi:aryl-alcohol dehydrogenase-like predicted oxidoreductase